VTLDEETPRVSVEYVDGPFQYLDNRWAFEPAPGGCTVDFYISYELKSLMLQLMVGAVFERAFRRFTEAFEQRAQHIYGVPRSDTVAPARTIPSERLSGQFERCGHGLEADFAPRELTEAAFLVKGRSALAGDGDMHQADWLGRAATARAGQARDGDRHIRQGMRERARRHGKRHLAADSAMRGDEAGIDADHLDLCRVGVGHERALEYVG
jgi:hypothetical protein